MMKKGQAAMEYLMTYGWAILVIVIVLAILAFYLPKLMRTPESCLFTAPGFDCNEQKPVIYANSNDEVQLAFSLQNKQGQAIVVKKVLCTTAASADVKSSHAADLEKGTNSIATKLRTVSAGGSWQYNATCKDKAGSTLIKKPNTEFKGLFVVWYNYDNEVSAPAQRTAQAVLTGTVLQQTAP